MDTAVVLNRNPAAAHGHAEVGIRSVVGNQDGYDMVSGNGSRSWSRVVMLQWQGAEHG